MCYAISTSSDPMGSYYRYEFLRPLFPDYPRPAIWTDGYYVPTSTGDNRISETVATQKHACVVERDKMLKALAQVGGHIDAIFFCPHTNADNCDCRKPKPGMFREIASRFNADLAGVPAIGDSLRDLQAGVGVGCEPHLVLTGKSAQYRGRELPAGLPAGTQVHDDLMAFADALLAR